MTAAATLALRSNMPTGAPGTGAPAARAPRAPHYRRRPLAAVVAALLILAGCTAPATTSETLTIFAAASLEPAFTDIAAQVEKDHPELTITQNFDGSSTLTAQIADGAPADILATADTATMDRFVADGLAAETPQVIATNHLTIAVPAGNPGRVDEAGDLDRPGLRLVTCAVQVPCGAAAHELANQLDLTLTPVSEETNVTGVLGKVTAGEADAGLVYATDIVRAGDAVEEVPLPEDAVIATEIPMVTVRNAQHTEAAQIFLDAVASEDGQRILAEHGFGPAES